MASDGENSEPPLESIDMDMLNTLYGAAPVVGDVHKPFTRSENFQQLKEIDYVRKYPSIPYSHPSN